MKNLNWRKILIVVVLLFGAWLTVLYGQPFLHETQLMSDGKTKDVANELAINVAVTIFSILAGFLITVITIVGDPALFSPGTWRKAEMEISKFHRRLRLCQWLLTGYLITLGSIFLALLLEKKFPVVALWLERSFLFCGFITFVCSFFLPGALMKIQKAKLDAAIEERRSDAGIG